MMKTFVLTISKNFMATHPKAGHPTEFYEKIIAGTKIHTIRGNYELWKKRIDQINEGKAVLSVREWMRKPYRSPQVELTKFTKVGIQKIEFDLLGWFIDDIDNDVTTGVIALNDGLLYADFIKWFKGKPIKDSAIIHFTNFRY